MVKKTVLPLLIAVTLAATACTKHDAPTAAAVSMAPQPIAAPSKDAARGLPAVATPTALVVPAEDRMEPASIEDARLPDGAALQPERPAQNADTNKTKP